MYGDPEYVKYISLDLIWYFLNGYEIKQEQKIVYLIFVLVFILCRILIIVILSRLFHISLILRRFILLIWTTTSEEYFQDPCCFGLFISWYLLSVNKEQRAMEHTNLFLWNTIFFDSWEKMRPEGKLLEISLSLFPLVTGEC